jgi:formiminotetrahydrofolate cyclodeaminase
MESPIWSATLSEFRESAGGTAPVPAGVAISAITGSLALALLTKVLEITRRRRAFAGDARKIEALADDARRESAGLARLADEDVRAFLHYMDRRRRSEPTGEAMREAIRVPMQGARAAVRGLDLCRESSPMCSTGMTAADHGVAATLLSGVLRAMLLSVESNLRELPADDPFGAEIGAELARLRVLAQIN